MSEVSEELGLHQVGDSLDRASDYAWVTVRQVKLEALRVGVRVRLGRVREDHLAAVAESGGDWPPIVVRREDNTIIDGHYRYFAARRLGHTEICCLLFDGTGEAAFLEALRRNLAHGLPLSLRDRGAAAERLLGLHPEWSDRRVAESCGLSPGTVRKLRDREAPGCSGAQNTHLNARVGRDGKRYPKAGVSRERVLTALSENPERSLRQLADETGVSPTTVRAIRTSARVPAPRIDLASAETNWTSTTGRLSDLWLHDAGLQATTPGRVFAAWFDRTQLADEWHDFVNEIPLSRVYEVADEARRRASQWSIFASTLEERARGQRASR
jgi:ParB-like chromosome segregation protein Spo0J